MFSKERKLKKNNRAMVKIDNMNNDDIDALCTFRSIKNMTVLPEALYSNKEEVPKKEKKDISWVYILAVIVAILMICAVWIVALNI